MLLVDSVYENPYLLIYLIILLSLLFIIYFLSIKTCSI